MSAGWRDLDFLSKSKVQEAAGQPGAMEPAGESCHPCAYPDRPALLWLRAVGNFRAF